MTASSSNPPLVLLFISSIPQSTPGESPQPPSHGAITSTVHLGPSSKSSGLARPSNIQNWYWILPPVQNARLGISSPMPKEALPSKHVFSNVLIVHFNSSRSRQWFDHHQQRPVQVESQRDRIQTRRMSTFRPLRN